MCAMWEPTPAYVRGVIRAERAIRNCASPRGEMPICAGCWSVPRNTFWDHLALTARCVNMELSLAVDGTSLAKKRAVVTLAGNRCVLLRSLWMKQTLSQLSLDLVIQFLPPVF